MTAPVKFEPPPKLIVVPDGSAVTTSKLLNTWLFPGEYTGEDPCPKPVGVNLKSTG